jgi:hypothetical protein
MRPIKQEGKEGSKRISGAARPKGSRCNEKYKWEYQHDANVLEWYQQNKSKRGPTTARPRFSDPSYNHSRRLASKQHWQRVTYYYIYVFFTSTLPLDKLVRTLKAESLKVHFSTYKIETKFWQYLRL